MKLGYVLKVAQGVIHFYPIKMLESIEANSVFINNYTDVGKVIYC